MNAHDQLRTDLGAYVLGALDAADQARLERHLATCEECQAELAALSALPAALGRLDVADLADLEDLADLDRILAEPPAEDRHEALAERAITSLAGYRRRVRRRVASAVAGVAVAAALVVGVVVLNQPASLNVTASAAAITASARLTDNAGGSAVVLRLDGVKPHQVCALVAEDTNGRRQTAATWVANYEGEAEVHGQSAIGTAELADLIVLGEGDVPLVTLPIKHT